MSEAADDDAAPADATVDLEIRLLLDGIRERYQHDFRQYAFGSLRRRLHQALPHLGCAHFGELQHRLLHDATVFHEALRYLTVQVSDMFRDPAYFRTLRRDVVPLLRTYPSIRLWVAGCSTGEEAWSMAVMLREEGLLDRTLVYATDIHPGSLRIAEAGVYPLARMAEHSRRYLDAGGTGSLSDHYLATGGGALMDRSLRRALVFAEHSLATDSVFSEVHLVSCRNVLIYFDRPLQDRCGTLFRDALVPRGFLGLGSQESLRFNAVADAFEVFDADQRLYRRRAG